MLTRHSPGHCPGDSDIQCAAKVSCMNNKGKCLSVGDQGCSGGSFHAGYCPGSSDIQCCVKDGSTDPPPSGDVAQKILAKAKTQEGVKYVFGGGSCSGPTNGGFDCSGLLCYAICQASALSLAIGGNY